MMGRLMQKQLYSGLQYRTFRNMLMRRLLEGYGYDNKIEIPFFYFIDFMGSQGGQFYVLMSLFFYSLPIFFDDDG